MSAKLNDEGLIQWIKCSKYIFFKNTSCKLKIMIGIQYITKDDENYINHKWLMIIIRDLLDKWTKWINSWT